MDFRLFELINQFAGRSGLLDTFMSAVAAYAPLLLALPLLYMWFRGNADAKKAALLSLLSMGIALLINRVIGHFYFRPRPFAAHEVNLLVERSADPSFPSDHVTFVFGIAFLVWLNDRRIGAVSLLVGVAVGIGRVFIGTHYPGDVLGGVLVGLVAALLVWSLRRKLDPITSFLIGVAKNLKLA